ncbi:hypothetical protein, partial [Pseudomonas sp. F1002]|uniref:hypothetical protein n=1 Tax=Pseudomonas sp. F1002 TaxID=2738821 RepID=UPI001C430A58
LAIFVLLASDDPLKVVWRKEQKTLEKRHPHFSPRSPASLFAFLSVTSAGQWSMTAKKEGSKSFLPP